MALKVKICGITTLEDARYAAGAGADFLGFVQYPGSPRYIAPKQARQIIEWVYGSEPVGVFVNEDANTINQIADEAGFNYVQLHGTEPPDICAQLERPVIKAIHVTPDATELSLRMQMDPYRDHVALFLLDTRQTGLWGGTGTPFDWPTARHLVADFPLLLAGGISAENVEEAVRIVQPLGIDLSSSVESAPGLKDFDKLQAFFDVVNEMREALGA